MALAMLAVTASGIFGTVAQAFGDHWYLAPQEANAIAEALHNALETLPEKNYEKLQQFISKYAPWCFLAITVGQIAYPRYIATKAIRDKPNNGNVGDEGSANNFNGGEYGFSPNPRYAG